MFTIEFTDGAIEDLDVFNKFEQRRIVAAIEAQLTMNPAQETADRKRLHTNGLAEWEIRIRKIRVFYDVQNGSVKVLAIGKNFFINLLYFRRRNRIGHPAHEPKWQQSLIVRHEDHEEYEASSEDDFNAEIEMTRASQSLEAFLQARAREPGTTSVLEIKKQLGLDG
jgi:mRNA-degrading endonuclease RelE of RelBE toxin-antitoxin system